VGVPAELDVSVWAGDLGGSAAVVVGEVVGGDVLAGALQRSVGGDLAVGAQLDPVVRAPGGSGGAAAGIDGAGGAVRRVVLVARGWVGAVLDRGDSAGFVAGDGQSLWADRQL
jgi:hypothetical protein